MNCEAYSSFGGVSSDHRIVTAKIRLSLRKNATRTATTKYYDWALLNNRDIRDKYVLELRNRFETLQEKEEKIPQTTNMIISLTRTSRRHRSVFQQNLDRNIEPHWKRKRLEKNVHLWKLPPKAIGRTQQLQMPEKKLKKGTISISRHISKRTNGIQTKQIDKIKESVEDRQSMIAWQTINKVSRRKSTAKAKLKAANQQERIKLWKQHFENLLANPPNVTQEPIIRIISEQLDIKLGPFTKEKLDSVLRKIKNRKAAGLDEIPPEVWKTRQFDDILLQHSNTVYDQNPIDRWTKGCILPFPKKGDLGLTKNYQGITLTSIAAKIYPVLQRNRIVAQIDKILRKKPKWLQKKKVHDLTNIDHP